MAHDISTLGSLAELPGCAVLRDICRDFKVEITAFGSVVRRLCQQLLNKPQELPDLFDLTPLLSDIDLKHSGQPEQTPAIRKAILGGVQSSECFRWDIHSETDLLEFRAD